MKAKLKVSRALIVARRDNVTLAKALSWARGQQIDKRILKVSFVMNVFALLLFGAHLMFVGKNTIGLIDTLLNMFLAAAITSLVAGIGWWRVLVSSSYVDGKDLQEALDGLVEHFSPRVLLMDTEKALAWIQDELCHQAWHVKLTSTISRTSEIEAKGKMRKMFDSAKVFFQIPSYEWYFNYGEKYLDARKSS